jgi:hypothetical protein
MTNNIDKFDRHLIKNNTTCLIIGKVLKDFAIKDILTCMKHISFAIIASTNIALCQLFLVNNAVKNIESFDQLKIRQMNLNRSENNKSLVLIDMENNKELYDQTYIKQMFYENKCYNITYLYTFDDCTNIQFNINVTYVFILGEKDEEKRAALYNNYSVYFESFLAFTTIMNSLKTYEILLIYDGKLYIFKTYLQPNNRLFN